MAYPRYSNPFGSALTPWITRLLVANVAVFLLVWALPGLVEYLAFVPAQALLRPWAVLTYMFVHERFWHLFGNMLGLFFFGPVLEERWGSREFIRFYLLCGLAGALLSAVFPGQAIIGASAAVYGIMVAFAMYWPDNLIYIYGILPVKAKWLVAFLLAASVFYAVTGGNAGVAHLAHLGGAAAAYLYLKSRFAPAGWGTVYTSPRKKTRRGWREWLPRRRRLTVESNAEPPRVPARPASPVDHDVDRILDKISERGIGSLTPEERRRLEEASRRSRAN